MQRRLINHYREHLDRERQRTVSGMMEAGGKLMMAAFGSKKKAKRKPRKSADPSSDNYNPLMAVRALVGG